ncbi:hypothetical protein F511_45648 [Dorcoceras hygrometricum]|uniref:Uncharacterized protein n=1 Tax=Dorcoceras hygrometricum TaxID=472368 RepID=A0A2Z6ZVN7_9LAMI|nr:hypothetical protein F511_45648 [Dorcoceras hygrometricum]
MKLAGRRTLLAARDARAGRALEASWPRERAARWRRWCARPVAAIGGQTLLMCAAGCAYLLHAGLPVVEQRCAASRTTMRAIARLSCAAAIFHGCGRLPAAAPASLRRCRDGWSDFF